MNIITKLAAAAGFVALAACSGGAEENTADTLEANTLIVDNLTTDMNMDMNADMNMDMNHSNMDMNATGNADATTNNSY